MTTERQAWKRIDELERRAALGASPFPDDTPALQAIRLVRSFLDIETFFRTYLPHYFRDPSPRFHKELIRICDRELFAAVAAPRGHAKSTTITFGHSVYELAFRLFWYEQIICASAEMAKEFVGGIADELADNDRLRYDFGNLRGEDTWTDNKFITRPCAKPVPTVTAAEISAALTVADREALAACTGNCDPDDQAWFVLQVLAIVGERLADDGTAMVEAFGRGQRKIRGRRHGPYRPDRIKGDDLEDDEQAGNADTTTKVIRWFGGAVRPGREPKPSRDGRPGRIFIVGTILGVYTLLNELLRPDRHKRFYKVRFSAIVVDPETGEERALWEDRWSLEALYEEREDLGEELFGKEFLSIAPDEAGKPFPTSLDDYEYFELSQLEGMRLDPPIIWCDPALGRNRKSDSPAILLERWWSKERVLFCIELDVTIRRPEQTCQRIVELMLEHDMLGEAVRFEDVGFQELMQPLFEQIAKEAGVDVFATGFELHEGDKDTHIATISLPVRRGRVRFRRIQKPAVRQFVTQPKGKKDGPDLVATAYQHHARSGSWKAEYSHRPRSIQFAAGAF